VERIPGHVCKSFLSARWPVRWQASARCENYGATRGMSRGYDDNYMKAAGSYVQQPEGLAQAGEKLLLTTSGIIRRGPRLTIVYSRLRTTAQYTALCHCSRRLLLRLTMVTMLQMRYVFQATRACLGAARHISVRPCARTGSGNPNHRPAPTATLQNLQLPADSPRKPTPQVVSSVVGAAFSTTTTTRRRSSTGAQRDAPTAGITRGRSMPSSRRPAWQRCPRRTTGARSLCARDAPLVHARERGTTNRNCYAPGHI
jgi:hypothetical protein